MIDKKLNESGETAFGNGMFSPLGRMGQWFAKFFASSAKPYIAQQGETNTPIPKDPLAGDTFTNTDLTRVNVMQSAPGLPSIVRNIIPAEAERTRKQRYRDLENMDKYPEISSSWDIYADDATQKDTKGRRWVIETDNPVIKKEVENLFKRIKLEEHYWIIQRNICKYGDCFTEDIIDENNPKQGIQRLKILNPNFIIRVENIYGYLTSFIQEIPTIADFSAFGAQSSAMGKTQYIALDKNQITHFRISSSDPEFYPYGRSIAASVIRTFKSLKMMEDAMLVYRLTRAPEKRVFYINVGNTPSSKIPAYLEKMKQKLRKEKMWNSSTNSIDERYNPLSVDEDLFVPHRGDKETKVEVLPGAQNLGDIDDVKYFMDKVLAGMKIPRDYVVESKDKGAERKANLSQLDAKFARTIIRVQQQFLEGLEGIVRKHLKIRGMPQHLINEVRIKLPDPSDIFTKRKLEIDEAKARVVAALKGTMLIPDDVIYKEYFELDDLEIEEYKAKLKTQMKEQAAMNPMGGIMGDPSMGSDPMAGGEGQETNAPGQAPNVGGRSGIIAQKQPGAAGMDAPANEALSYIKRAILNESNTKRLKTLKKIEGLLNSKSEVKS